jgi:hypothetical protein
MMIAGLTKPGTFELTMKMASTLRESFGVETTFCDGQISSYKRMTSNEVKQQFLCGKHFIVMPSYAQHRAEYLNEVDAKKVLVLMDESDVVMKRIEWAPNSKEAKLIEIIGRPHEDSSRVTGVVNVSATHMGDMYLWKRVMGNVPQDSVFVPPDLLKSRGFTTQDEMTLFSSRVSQDDAKPPKQYGFESRGFKDLMQDFKTCSGRRKLMMVASCPRVSAGASTLYTQARRVLQDDMDPQAIVMVHHSGKCVALLRDQNGTIIEKHMRKRQVLNAGSITSPRRVRIVNITTAGEALTKLENMYCQNGVDRRFIAIGYNAFARTASVRTSTMVITHMFAFLTKGRHSADVRQTLMRPAGRTTNVRKENNGGVETHVKVVTPMEDWHMVTELYKFQVWLAEKRMEDPSFDMVNALCPLEYDPVVASNRSHAPNTMKFRPEWRVDATRRERRVAASERKNEQRERETEREAERLMADRNDDNISDFIVDDRNVEYEDDVLNDDEEAVEADIATIQLGRSTVLNTVEDNAFLNDGEIDYEDHFEPEKNDVPASHDREESRNSPISKMGIVTEVPTGAVVLTKFHQEPTASFFQARGMTSPITSGDYGSNPATNAAKKLKKQGLNCHVSIADVSAESVSDISNFFRNPRWCNKPYHVIIHADTTVMIERFVDVIKTISTTSLTADTVFVSHKHNGDLQLWKLV